MLFSKIAYLLYTLRKSSIFADIHTKTMATQYLTTGFTKIISSTLNAQIHIIYYLQALSSEPLSPNIFTRSAPDIFK